MTWRPGRCFFLSIVPVGSESVGGRVGASGVFCPRCRWVSAGDTGSGAAALGAPAFGGLAALKTPRSAWPALGRGNRSRVPAWPLPGASPVPLPKGWARVHSCPTELRGLSSEYLSGTCAEGQRRSLTASSSPSLAADFLWVSLPKWWLFSRWRVGGTTCSFGPSPGDCHL